MGRSRPKRPDWDALYEVAATQEGHFTTQQADGAGFSLPLLTHHLNAGKLNRIRRGIYRLHHFPPGDHEDLVVVWLWSEQAGVFSHQTALSLHGLSDVLPARVHLTLPASWQQRRLREPKGVTLHYAEIPEADRSWMGPVQITSPARTLTDCAETHLSLELMNQALAQAGDRGLVAKAQLKNIKRQLDSSWSDAQ